MRAHPVFGDTLIAGFIALFDFGMEAAGRPMPFPVLMFTGALLVVPLVFRRKYPVVACYLVVGGGVVQLLTLSANLGSHDVPIRFADLSLGIALYTMVAYVGRRQALLYALWLAVGTVLWAAVAATRQSGSSAAAGTFAAVMIFAFCWAMGAFVGARRAYQVELEQRLKLLETERDQQARIAVGSERARIARELHDVVAHAVSVMVVQADGAGYALRSDPDLAETALRTISETGRQALTELRRLLGVLRSDEDPGGERTPQPDARGLDELADKVRSVGLPVRLVTSGDLVHLPVGVGLGIYRIVQEALTNTLKHAGAGASAAVHVTRTDDHVELEISDDGFGTPHDLVAVSGGNGLIGMRERAAVFGGTLDAGPKPGGGWRVRAVLPLTANA
ncbi:sensor histidine kinase [Solihabitans fulvus]|uniref:histidine kinase n=1 Tax=Solihabitans fulvus TaxID=1892852 RepID=A0A5B2WKK5_9PSEU|nr:sensor histidine kinase [Solihabitans fulvus]KAA2251458.1 sensor histidine kinase [Solihabitans fulvus]